MIAMENDIQIFQNPEIGEIRVKEMNGEPMFCASDICNSLGYTNTSKAVSDNVEDCDRYNQQLERGGKMIYVNESGLYSIILKSNMPKAKEFKHWVTSEVLPCIRKHGAYMNNATIERTITDPDYLILLASTIKRERAKREEAEANNKRLEAMNDAMKPKAEFADAVFGSSEAIDMRMVATTLNIGIGRNKLFELLRDKKILDRRNMPYQTFVDRGYFRTIESTYNKPDGSSCINIKTVVYQKGVDFIRRMLMKGGEA